MESVHTANAAAAKSVAAHPFSTARKLMIAALLIHFCSLFFVYQDEDSGGGRPILWNTGQFVTISNTIPEQTGFKLKPYAAYIIGGLLLLFYTGFYDNPGWQKWGYWVSLVLVVLFAMGGAVVRTTGGKLSLLSLGLMLVAALLNMAESKSKRVTA